MAAAGSGFMLILCSVRLLPILLMQHYRTAKSLKGRLRAAFLWAGLRTYALRFTDRDDF